MIKHLLCVLAGLAATAVQSQIITTPDARGGLLSGLDVTTGNVARPAADFTRVPSPFTPPDKSALLQETVSAAPDGAISEVGAQLPDEDALRAIAEKFKPIGSLVLGSRGILKLESGRTLEKGESFSADIGGRAYQIFIDDVTTQGYTLRLGEAVLKRNFLTTTGATQ